MPSAESKPWTYDDYCLLPEDGRRHEILAGEHVVTPSPNTRHQRLAGRLFAALKADCEASGQGEAFIAPYDVLLDSATIVQPDVLVVLERGPAIVTTANVQGSPNLVIEVLSGTTRSRDLGVKRRLYQHFGVEEIWMVDPDAEAVTVAQTPQFHSRTMTSDRRLESAVIEGLAIDLSKLFAR